MCLTGCTNREKLEKDSKGKSGESPESTTSTCSSDGTCFVGGDQVHDDDKSAVKTGATYQVDGKDTAFKDGIAIRVKCKKNPHIVQFINREVIDKDGNHKSAKIKTTGGEYDLTTDPENPSWNTDSAGHPNPYYESAGVSVSDSDGLTIFDQPRLTTPAGILKLKEGETSKANFKAYAICDGKVVQEISWSRSQKFGEDPVYNVEVKDASALPDWADKQLKDQGYDPAP